MKHLKILSFLILINTCLCAQHTLDTASVKKTLEIIFERDQKTRTGKDSVEFMASIDSSNQAYVVAIIEKYGWLGKSAIGVRGNCTLWLVIQHADLPLQEKYLPIMEKSVSEGESRIIDLALLKDRVLMRQGKQQIYGSQVILNNTGGQELYPIADEKNVNKRRAEIGLEPIEEYAKRFGIDYKNTKLE